MHYMQFAYVQSRVLAEDLLVWKVKDGWEPLCKFLNCPVPEESIPHDNRTGDTRFMGGPVYSYENFDFLLNSAKFLIVLEFEVQNDRISK